MADIMTGAGFTRFVDALCDHSIRTSKLRQLAKDIAGCEPRCGNCYHWMKSGSCPRETRTPQGRRSGPNNHGYPCSKFEIEDHIAERKADLLRQVEALRKEAEGRS